MYVNPFSLYRRSLYGISKSRNRITTPQIQYAEWNFRSAKISLELLRY